MKNKDKSKLLNLKFVEKVEVRGRAIHVTLPQPIGSVTGYHLFIVYTEKHGKQFVCQGLPFDPATGKIAPDEILPSDPPGLLTKGQCIPFRPDNIDFIPDAPSLTAVEIEVPWELDQLARMTYLKI